MRRQAEPLRWFMALAGLGFWLTGFWVLFEGGNARWQWRCAGRPPAECFSDYLPIFEAVIAPALVLLLAYPVARFIFTMWAPPPEARTMYWWPASRRGGGDLLRPVGQLLAAAGIVSSLWTLLVFPLAAEFRPYYLYWGASALWCALTLWVSWPARQEMAA